MANYGITTIKIVRSAEVKEGKDRSKSKKRKKRKK